MILLDDFVGRATEIRDLVDGSTTTVHPALFRYYRVTRAGTGTIPQIAIGTRTSEGCELCWIWNDDNAANVQVNTDNGNATVVPGEVVVISSKSNGNTFYQKFDIL